MRHVGILIDPNAMMPPHNDNPRIEPLFIPLMTGHEFEVPSFSKSLEKKVFEAWKKNRIG